MRPRPTSSLDPDPQPELIEKVLSKHHFRDVKQAYQNLMALSEEKIRFLSMRRCRHFLAAIAADLLKEVGATADPDAALVNLDRVSDSLGGKGVLWELFSFNPPSLRLYVELCAYSPHLSNILISNPGMIDGLMDSLVLDRLPSRDGLVGDAQGTLLGVRRHRADPAQLQECPAASRRRARPVLGKEDPQATTSVLSTLRRLRSSPRSRLRNTRSLRPSAPVKPRIGEGSRAGAGRGDMAILAMGKFGGREMNYHSDLDIIFLYEADGQTAFDFGQWSARSTSNQHFFSELGQRIITKTSRLSALGKLYEVDARLRPTGKSGSLAITMGEFNHYHAEGSPCQLWEAQAALCKRSGRSTAVLSRMRPARRRWLCSERPSRAAGGGRMPPIFANTQRHGEHRRARGDFESRGHGGIVDIEFLVQTLQLQHARKNPGAPRVPNTLAALRALLAAEIMHEEEHHFFDSSYRFLRTIESRLQLMNSTARDQLPRGRDRSLEQAWAHLLRYSSGDALMCDYEKTTSQIRERFDAAFDAAGNWVSYSGAHTRLLREDRGWLPSYPHRKGNPRVRRPDVPDAGCSCLWHRKFAGYLAVILVAALDEISATPERLTRWQIRRGDRRRRP